MPDKLFEIVDGKVIVTTATGWRVECLPYGDDLMRAGTALVLPDAPEPPTYVLGQPEEGERQIRVPYTDTSIEDENTPAEDTEAWGEYLPLRAAYEQEVAAIQEQKFLMRARVMVHKATKILDLPDLHAWAKEQEEFYGIPTPGDDREILSQFFTTEVAKIPDDVMRLMAGILRATGATEEALDQFEDNFRVALGNAQGEDAQADTEGTPAEAKDEAGGLVDGATVEPA